MPPSASNSFPGDDRCETLNNIRRVISQLPNISQTDKDTAIKGIDMAMNLLKCDD